MLILTLLVLAGAQAPAARERTPAVPTGASEDCRDLWVSSTAGETRQRVFSASEVTDLRITTTFPNTLVGSRRLQLRLLTPQGHLYQRFSIPFDATLPRHERGAVRSIGVTLPVAGTAITQSGLYGRWTVIPYLDDELLPCTEARRFVLNP